MCIQDIRIRRACRTTYIEVPTKVLAISKLLDYDPKRVCVVIGQVVTGTTYVTWAENATNIGGFIVNGGAFGNGINIWDHGSLPFGPIYGMNDTANSFVPIVISTLEDDELLEMLRKYGSK